MTRRNFTPWHVTTTLICGLLLLPIITIISFVFTDSGDVWKHLSETVLSDYVLNSLLLTILVAIGSIIIGVSCAWLTTMYNFKGRQWFHWALLLPMAMPAYIIAFTYTEIYDVSSLLENLLPLQAWRDNGWYWLMGLPNLLSASLMFIFVLYPYVYLLSRASFLEQSICVLDVGRTLGLSTFSRFFKIALPLARPSIIAGTALVVMEVLADYGTVQYYGVSTFTTGIFRTWFGLGDSQAAAQLSTLLLLTVFLILSIERISRRRSSYHHSSQRHQKIIPKQLTHQHQIIAIIICFTPILLGFILPTLQLSKWAWQSRSQLDAAFIQLSWNSFWLAGITAVLALFLALVMAYSVRIHPKPWIKFSVRLASLGYAIPGAVIAVGVMLPSGYIDNLINQASLHITGERVGLVLSGTFLALIFTYLVRFMAVALGSVESGLSKIKSSLDDASQTLGHSKLATMLQVHLPMLKGTLLTTTLIVFVDVLKELPATLVMRPFNFNTLAVRAYELAADERLADAALPAIAIVLTGLIPVILLSRSIATVRSEKVNQNEAT